MAGLLYLHHGQLVEVHELRSILHRPVPQNHCSVSVREHTVQVISMTEAGSLDWGY
ncbi:hypothetical protein BDA96_10G158100 [Sorghum bicolor]|uniref:Uncharacterized protein n=2 Tax=Sorghum bicolor TaxID=4558 RepID=A0A921Q5D4_SORBI|nr:hypothetical protein BDA96_10G158100 [Sorghum bicolor]KXG19862.1 hypothetical protein SORBI_3010G127100 [Sorghum bicolor]